MHITIDPYYDTKFYNEAKQALKNNGVEYSEFINIKPPYNWYLDIQEKPVMINFDSATDSEIRYMVSVVKPLKPSDEYLLMRRDNDAGSKALAKFVENEPLRIARKADYAVFFNVKNRETLERITREYPGKIWYFGKYYKNMYRVCLATHEVIRGFIGDDDILLEKTSDMKVPGQFEAMLNWKIFRANDYLVKFTETPYFENGQYNRPSIRGDYSSTYQI